MNGLRISSITITQRACNLVRFTTPDLSGAIESS
jgi:hypothetical protein